jgi:hypothetical protein
LALLRTKLHFGLLQLAKGEQEGICKSISAAMRQKKKKLALLRVNFLYAKDGEIILRLID